MGMTSLGSNRYQPILHPEYANDPKAALEVTPIPGADAQTRYDDSTQTFPGIRHIYARIRSALNEQYRAK